MQLFGMEVDFCNLRKETYAQGHSRVPVIEIGTPLEDAMRRDLTINSLFYNIHSEQVEDHLGTGLRDLRDGIIRTPLPPLETFRDDPLRVLRTIRFASRFNYSVVHEIPVAIRDPSISVRVSGSFA
jgi:tRNA nucleotidyltransferase (CCA-adding enzyme)